MSFLHQFTNLVFVCVVLICLSVAISHLVEPFHKSKAVSSLTYERQLADMKILNFAKETELIKERNDIINSAAIEQQLIALGKHPKLHTYDA
jgi:hypothetical protein